MGNVSTPALFSEASGRSYVNSAEVSVVIVGRDDTDLTQDLEHQEDT